MQPKHFESLYPANTREKELAQIVEYIKEGASCQIIGIPGSGRSNILGLLSHNHAIHLRHFPTHHQDVHFVMLNFTEVAGKSLSDVWKFFLLTLITSLQERGMTIQYKKVDEILKKSLSYHDEFAIGQGLKSAIEYLAVEEKLTIIFLFDKFESFVPVVTKEFFTMLRALRDRAKYRFSILFSLSRSLDEVLDQDTLHNFSDFISGHTIYIGLRDGPSATFRLSYIEGMMKKTVSAKDRDLIQELTGGHIRLTKLAYEAVLSGEQSDVAVDFFLEQKKIDNALSDIWGELTPSEQAFLKEDKEDESAREYLAKVGLFMEGKIQIPLFEKWLKNLPDAKEDLAIDQSAQVITLGGRVISDDLTKAEYRLLSYLLIHKDQVVERDTIVEQVWTQNKSTQGVTEQAIDQLIFRLRKKVEKDPNSPTHILTIKGRGIKLV